MDYKQKALRYAEQHGIIEYSVSGHIMEYLTFYGQDEGWWYIAIDLESMRGIYRGKAFPWMGWIPEFLKDPETGATKYNYYCG